MVKRLILLALPLLYFALNANAEQNRDSTKAKSKLKDRISISANVGGFYSGNSYNLLLNPMIMYRATDRLSIGAGPYFSTFGSISPKSSNKVYGTNAMSRYTVTKNLFAQAQFDLLNFEHSIKGRVWNKALLLGGGYYSNGASLQVLYNVFHDKDNSPYGPSPLIIQGGFGIRL